MLPLPPHHHPITTTPSPPPHHHHLITPTPPHHPTTITPTPTQNHDLHEHKELVVSLFVTSEHGVHIQDRFHPTGDQETLLDVLVPYYYFTKKVSYCIYMCITIMYRLYNSYVQTVYTCV